MTMRSSNARYSAGQFCPAVVSILAMGWVRRSDSRIVVPDRPRQTLPLGRCTVGCGGQTRKPDLKGY
jgi:hypothetical protein